MAKSATPAAKTTCTTFQEAPKTPLLPSPSQADKRTYPFAKTASTTTGSTASINKGLKYSQPLKLLGGFFY